MNNYGYMIKREKITGINPVCIKDVLNYFGNQADVAQVLGISQAAVSKWPKIIPLLRALQLEKLTNGKLKADEKLV